MQIQRMRLKICLVGDRGVGKTSLIRRFAGRQFLDDERGTLGAHMHPVEVEIPLDGDRLAKVRVDLFDFMGEHALRDNFRDAIFYGAHGVLAVCDVTRMDTLTDLDEWVAAVVKVTGQIPVEFLANKADLKDQQVVTAEDLESAAKTHDAPFLFTSAKTGENVEQAFANLAKMISARAHTA